MFGKKKISEAELIQGCVDNNRRCQELFYKRFFQTMMRMCLRHTQDEETAMHIVNTGMLRVFKKIGTFEGRGSLEGWVRRLVWHALADYFRSAKRYTQFIVLEDPSTDLRYGESPADSLAEQDILNLVHQLPTNTQKVFILYAIEGFSHKEIAGQLDFSEGTSKWHLNSARTKLKALLKARDENPRTATTLY